MKAASDAIAQLQAEIEDIHEERFDENGSALADASDDVPNIEAEFKNRVTLKGHFGKIYAMHWAEDCISLVSASQDGKLILWNGPAGLMNAAIPIRSAWVMTVAYAPSKRFVACGGLDNLCSVYQLTDGLEIEHKLSRELAKHEGYLSCCRFIDDDQILTSSGDATCILWDINTKTHKSTFRGHDSDVMSLSLGHDSNTFVSGSTDALAKIWDIRTGACETTYGHESDINSVDFMPQGHAPCFVSGSDDSFCRFFDLRSLSLLQNYHNAKTVSGVTSCALAHSGRLLFAGYDDSRCQAWDVLKGKVVHVLSKGNISSESNCRVSCLGVSSDGTAMCTGDWDQLLRVYA